jgi:hypothetical protein
MNQNNQPLIKASVTIVIIAGLVAALSLFAGGINPVEGKLFAICFSLIFFSITAVISFAAAGKHGISVLGTLGMMASVIAFMLVFVIIMAEIDDDSILKLAFTFFIISIALAHINLLHYFTLQNKYALYARIAATAAISVFSVLVIAQIFSPFQGMYSITGYQSAYKLIIASLVIDLAATVLVPLCNRLEAEKPPELTLGEEKPVEKDPGAVL